MRSVLRRTLPVIVSFLLAFTIVTPIARADDLALTGTGTLEDPYLIATADDLNLFAASVNDTADDETGATAESHARLTDDIDFAGAEFAGIDRFSGVIDGDGFTLSNLTYSGSEASNDRALVRTLEGGTITRLGIDSLTVEVDGNDRVAALAIDITGGAVVDGNSVTNTVLSTGHDYVSGLVEKVEHGGEVTNNYVHGTFSSVRYPAAVMGYARHNAVASNNLVNADVTATGTNARGGLLLAYQGNSNTGATNGSTTISSNALIGGSLGWDDSVATETNRTHRVVAVPHSGGYLNLENNIASDAITVGGIVPESSDIEGTTVAAEQFALQQTYVDLGWDFTTDWAWQDSESVPVPAAFYDESAEDEEPVEDDGLSIEGLEGSGTAEEPFQIGSVENLDAFATALNEAAGSDDESLLASHVILTADIDYENATFVGIDRFTGVLDGDGFTISNIVYGPSASSQSLGLIRNLVGGTVQDLGISDVTAVSENAEVVAGLVVESTGGAVIDGNRVTGAELSTSHQYAAGLVYQAANGVDVTNNLVEGAMTSHRYPAAVVGYGRYSVIIENNVAIADITTIGNQSRAGMVVGYQGNSGNGATSGSLDVRGNALAGGSITWDEEALTATPSSHRVIGAPHSTGFLNLADNIASDEITIGGTVPESSDVEGQTVPAAEFSVLDTYVGVGFDFTGDWAWDEEASSPVPAAFHPEGVLDPEDIPEEPEDPSEELAIEGLEGSGTESDPFLVGSADDLTVFTTAVNDDAETLGSSFVELTSDIDFGGGTFPGIHLFSGSFDGAGHMISNITYGPGNGSNELGFIRNLEGGTLRNLTIDGLTVEELGDYRVAGLVVYARHGAVIDGNAVTNADLTSGNQYVAGIAAFVENEVRVTNNWVHGVFSSTRYGSATVGYGRYGSVVENNLVNATVISTGNRAHAGLLLGYMGAPGSYADSVLQNNVAFGGIVDWLDGKDAVISSIILGQYANGGWQVENNLANENILVGGQTVSGPGEHGEHGTPVTDEALGQQSTYEDLGWDFDSDWVWSDELGHPVPSGATVPDELEDGPGIGDTEIEGIDGEGTEASPYLISSPEDLDTVTEAINSNPLAFNTGHYQLATNIDYRGGTFIGIDQFRGTLDGNGYKIYNIAYGPSENSDERALIRSLDGGVVKNLTIDGVITHISQASQVSALVSNASNGATIDGNTVINADLSTGAQYVAGIAANAQNGVTVTNNWVEGTFRSARYPAAVVGYGRYGVEISNNLVNADVSSRGNRAHGGMILSYMGGYSASQPVGTAEGNVIYDGRVHWTGGNTATLVGRILGQYANGGWVVENNLANESVRVGNSLPDAPGAHNEHGIDTTAEALANQQTYIDLGWDFDNAWTWDEDRGHPVPQRSFLFGSGTQAQPFTIDTASDLEFLAELINSGDTSMLGGQHIAITTDLDFAGREPFPGLDRFDGTIDGRNHTISNMTLAPSDSSNELAFIRDFSGSASNISFDSLSVETDGTEAAAGFALRAEDADLRSITMVDAVISAPNAEVAAGLVAYASGETVIDQNLVRADVTAKVNPGGVAGHVTDSASVTRNLVTSIVTVIDEGVGTVGGGLVAAAPSGTATITGNVVLGTALEYTGTVDGHAGRVIGYTGADGWLADENLAYIGITVSGETVTGPGVKNQHGTDADESVLGDKATYENLGWDFLDHWRWDTELDRPVVKYVLPEELPTRITATFYGDTETQRAFTWYQTGVEDPDAAAIRVSTDPALPKGETTRVEFAEHRTATHGETVFQVVVNDLEPGTEYYYSVGDSTAEIWSETGTFVTADGDGEFTFIDLTDTQAKGTAEANMSAHTMREALRTLPEAEFMVHNGDVVQDSHVSQDWIDLFSAAQDSLLATTIAPASGNHDLHPGTFIDHFMLEHPNGQDTETGAYYSYTYNDAHFMVLNTNEDEIQSVTEEQIAWIEEESKNAREDGAQWLILVMHKGLYTAGNHADDADIMAMREQLVPVIDELEIDLVLQGHDHYYSRTKVLQYDADGTEFASPVETSKFTEVVNGKRYEYSVNPDGTIYYMPNTAGSKHYNQHPGSEFILIDAFLDLFDRLGTPRHGTVQTFTGITVAVERLTVEVYHISGDGTPVLAEGFGIDRQTEAVAALIDALPAPVDVTLDHEDQVRGARAAVDAMSSAQREILPNLDRLVAVEKSLRELQGLISADGSEVAWFEESADHRQAMTVRNESNKDFTDAPVRLTIEDTPNTGRDSLTFTLEDGTVLSHEVESWNPGDSSIVWVKLPVIAAHSVTPLWAYYGGDGLGADAADVWGKYALVDHMMEPLASGQTRTDSTGRHTGTLLGDDLEVVTSADGTVQTRFEESKIQYPGNIGGGYSQLAVSALYSFTEEDVAGLSPNGGAVVGKQRPTDAADPAFAQVVGVDGTTQTRYNNNSHQVEIPADGEPHLVTQTYDGMTLAIFVDGVQQHEAMVERRETNSDPTVQTTIGDLYTDDGSAYAPFRGHIDEVQIAGFPFLPEYERFRYANYFGTAVSYGDIAGRGELSLTIGNPTPGTEVEAGLIEFDGTLSKRATVEATIGDDTVYSGTVDAGKFTLEIPVNPVGEQTVVLTAVTEDAQASASVDVNVSDTTAPNQPIVTDNSADVSGEGADVELRVTPDTDDRERVEARFYANNTARLDTSNVAVRTGSTEDRTPEALTPQSGEPADTLLGETVAENANPFQIYTISLNEDDRDLDEFHVTWTGTGDDRRVSAWVYDHGAQKWLLKDDAADAEGNAVSLDITALSSENAVDSGEITVLIWRGMTSLPFGPDYVYEQYPDAADFDWAFNHVPDTQLYAEATPWMMNDMFSHIVADADERKTELILQAGDWVNREHLFDEYQWRTVDPSARMMEEAGIPFMISWGNHDYSESRNGRVMLEKWFPMERFEASTQDTPFTFGGSFDIDNYYYTTDIEGSQLLFLSLGYWSSNTDDDPGIAWAQEVIEAHPDHEIILLSHNYLTARNAEDPYSNPRINDLLVDRYPNIRLVFTGHNSGSYVTTRQADHGGRSYGILTDYQTRPWGGHEFYKNISVDAENGLLYFNTYSPWLDTWTSDGRWHSPVSEEEVPGFHGDDSENFVLEIDLGFTTTRTIKTEGLTMAAGAPTQVGEPVTLVGDEQGNVLLEDVELDREYEWYAELTDQEGHVTRSETLRFTIGETVEPPHADIYEPSYGPLDLVAGETATAEISFEPALADGLEPTYELDDSTVPTDWQVTVADSGAVTVTTPEDAEALTATLAITVTYGDESTDRASLQVAVEAAEEAPLADMYEPSYDRLDLVAGGTATAEISFEPALAEGLEPTYVLEESTVPADWQVTVADSGAVTVTTPEDAEALTATLAITVTYGDESTDRASLQVAMEAAEEPTDPEEPTEEPTDPTDPEEPGEEIERTGNVFFLVNDWDSATHDIAVSFGRIGDEVIVGDWDGDDIDTLAVRRGETFFVDNEIRGGDAEISFKYGRIGDEVIAGDWDGDGIDTFGVRRGDEFFLRNTLRGGNANVSFHYGKDNDEVLVGDWDDDGVDTIVLRRGNEFLLSNAHVGGWAEQSFKYGRAADDAFAGDFDGDGTDTISTRRGNTFFINNVLVGGHAEHQISYGKPNDTVLIGDWDGDGRDTPGVNRIVR